jgi:hypothetical protein
MHLTIFSHRISGTLVHCNFSSHVVAITRTTEAT